MVLHATVPINWRIARFPANLFELLPPIAQSFLDLLFHALLGRLVKDFVHFQIILRHKIAGMVVGEFVALTVGNGDLGSGLHPKAFEQHRVAKFLNAHYPEISGALIFCSISIELLGSSAIFRPVKRNAIETVETPDGARAARLNPVEVDIIHLFVQLSRALGQPPSVAEIYGLLFISPNPLPQDDFIERLNLSKGSASQGLRYLLDLGAVRTVYVAGDRRVHYEAVAEPLPAPARAYLFRRQRRPAGPHPGRSARASWRGA